VHLVGFIIRIYHDARLPERQNVYFTGATKKNYNLYIIYLLRIHIYSVSHSLPNPAVTADVLARTFQNMARLSGRKWFSLPAHVVMSSHFLHNAVSPLQISLQYPH